MPKTIGLPNGLPRTTSVSMVINGAYPYYAIPVEKSAICTMLYSLCAFGAHNWLNTENTESSVWYLENIVSHVFLMVFCNDNFFKAFITQFHILNFFKLYSEM